MQYSILSIVSPVFNIFLGGGGQRDESWIWTQGFMPAKYIQLFKKKQFLIEDI
jgi:hypothetical protein